MVESELSLVYKIAPTIRTEESASGGFTGYASTFNFLDYHNDIVMPGAYKGDIQRYLQKGFIGGVGHDHSNPIGKPTRLFEDAKGLFLEARLIDTEKAQEARKLITEGVVKELSVGIQPMQVKHLRTRKEVQEYWAKSGHTPTEEELMRAEGGARLIKRAKLLEISPVALAANEQSEILTFKAGRKISQTNAQLLAQVCQQLEAAHEMLETLLVDAGIKEPDEEPAEAEKAEAPVSDPYSDLLAAFRDFLTKE